MGDKTAMIIIFLFLDFFVFFLSHTLFFVLVFIQIGILVIALNQKDRVHEKAETELSEKQEKLKEYNVPEHCQQYHYISGIKSYTGDSEVYTWIDNNGLSLLNNNFIKTTIPIENIHFYTIKGDLKYVSEETKKTNNGMGGAMIDEVLYGTAAAVKKHQATAPKIVSSDERITVLKVSIENSICFLSFKSGEFYNYLLQQIPAKEQSFVS